jgi:SRSO17 transposase
MGKKGDSGASRFDEYVNRLAEQLGHADRLEPLRAYLTGLLLPGERKTRLRQFEK